MLILIPVDCVGLAEEYFHVKDKRLKINLDNIFERKKQKKRPNCCINTHSYEHLADERGTPALYEPINNRQKTMEKFGWAAITLARCSLMTWYSPPRLNCNNPNDVIMTC